MAQCGQDGETEFTLVVVFMVVQMKKTQNINRVISVPRAQVSAENTCCGECT